MIKGKLTKAFRMRYLIPFTYSLPSGNTYDSICQKLQKSKEWTLSTVRAASEQDIYEYLLHSFERNELNNNIGTAWKYVKVKEKNSADERDQNPAKEQEKISQALLQLLYLIDNKDTQDMPMTPAKWLRVAVTEAGMFLFRSGVGFFWYEIRLNKDEPMIDDLVKFQNRFKELNRVSNGSRIMQLLGRTDFACLPEEESGYFKSAGEIILDYYNSYPEEAAAYKNKKELFVQAMKKGAYIPCFNGGSMRYVQEDVIKSVVENADQTYTATDYEKLVYYKELRENAENQIPRRIGLYHCRTFTMGNWIAEVLGTLPVPVQYCAQRKNCMKTLLHASESVEDIEKRSLAEYVPDKALIFIYAVQKAQQGDLGVSAYYLTNGYTEAYQMPAAAEASMFRPFENALWCASREGCGYFVEDAGQDFFRSGMLNRVVNDYFLLYVLALHQSYTLLNYAGSIERSFSADELDYQIQSEAYTGKLESYLAQMNTFFMKSTYASVSHVQHQNDFYGYVQKRLQIKENISSIMMGMEALSEIQGMRNREVLQQKEQELAEIREKESNQLNIALSLLSILTVISVLLDATSFIQLLLQKIDHIEVLIQNPQNWVYIAVYVLVGAAGIYATYRLIRSVIKEKQLEKKQKDETTVKYSKAELEHALESVSLEDMGIEAKER